MKGAYIRVWNLGAIFVFCLQQEQASGGKDSLLVSNPGSTTHNLEDLDDGTVFSSPLFLTSKMGLVIMLTSGGYGVDSIELYAETHRSVPGQDHCLMNASFSSKWPMADLL